jgi:glutamate-1-semialdehyde 2,1-aminomutase
MTNRYIQSQEYFKKAHSLIPLASQTLSKSYMNFPQNETPLFVERGAAAHIWDIDGNEYVDFMAGLLSILVGYNETSINNAITNQLNKGINFSLATTLEAKLADKLVSLIPCAEMVRFGKNGSDVTSGAIRLARAYTGRDHVAVCGYHGWQDWYIGSTARDLGVPDSTKQMTHTFEFNNSASLEQIFLERPNQVAAVILEPMNREFPDNDFLENARQLCSKHGALLVFDEIITGLRFAKGGAQEKFNVTPDLACFGKGMGNGMPISALVGPREIMQLLEKVHFSFTAGGEALSLAAANAVVDLVVEENIPNDLYNKGALLKQKLLQSVHKYGLEKVVGITGYPAWQFIEFTTHNDYSNSQIMQLWKKEMINSGIFISTTFNLMARHTLQDIDDLCHAADQFFAKLSDDKWLDESLRGERAALAKDYAVR